jgi:hypothetical protein
MLFFHPLHSLSPPSFFLLLGDFGVFNIAFDLGDFTASKASDVFGDFGFAGDFSFAGDFGDVGFAADLGDFGFAGRLCFFKTLAFSSLANSDFRIS